MLEHSTSSAANRTGREGLADVPGGRVWWRVVGSGPGRPLLVLHGGPGSGHDGLLPLAALSDARPVVFYDQLGCGQSESPPEPATYTIQRAVEEVDAVRRALGLSTIDLYGHSWGSILAIEYLCQGRGDGVGKLVLSGAIASVPQFVAGARRLIAAMPGGVGRRMAALEAAGKTETAEYEGLVKRFYDRHFCRIVPHPANVARSARNLERSIAYRVMNGPNEFTVTGVIRDWSRADDLGRITQPTLITTGEFDEVTPDVIATVQRGIPGSMLRVFPGCSHLTMNEDGTAYEAVLRSFLR